MNVINDPWLYVRYLNNEVKQVSVRQAFIDAEIIKNIESPTFHDVKVVLYDVPVIQFLSTLLLASYFKPENEFKAKNRYFNKELQDKGWDITLILKYLDTWRYKFNLKDDTYPFLQDITLKDLTSSDDTFAYICRTNIAIPSGANLLFERNPNGSEFKLSEHIPTLDECVYMLLYLNSLSTSPMATAYPNKALCTNQTLFALAFGKNLKETIIYNSLQLKRNIATEELYDRPVWELTSVEEIKDYLYEDNNLSNNTLLCSFFPSQPVYIKFENHEPVNIQLAKNFISFMSKEEKNKLADNYVITNPWMVAKQNKDTEEYSYKEWTNSLKLISLCIDITKKGVDLCNMISDKDRLPSNARCIIYYREYDGMKTNIMSFGKYEIKQEIFNKLQIEDNHEKAEIFQDKLSKIQSKFNILKKESDLDEFTIKNLRLTFSKYSEDLFFNEFISNIENAETLNLAIDKLIIYAKKIVKNYSELSSNPIKYAESYVKFCGALNKIRKELI